MSLLLGIVLIIFFLGVQAFFAGSEMGLISYNRIRLRHLVDKGDRKAIMIQHLLEHPERFLGTTLVGVNIAVIIVTTLTNELVYRHMRVSENVVSTIAALIIFPLIIIFGEIVPMSVSRIHSSKLVRIIVTPLRAMYWILLPIVSFASFISKEITRLIGGIKKHKNPFVTREELRLLLREGAHPGLLDKEGRRMIHEIFDLQNTFAKDIMTPLIDVKAAYVDSSVDEVIKIMRDSGHSRIPIYETRIDDIVGIVTAFDLIDFTKKDLSIGQILKQPYIVPEMKPIDDILLEFQLTNKNFAVVVDEYGGVSGILTLEDIIEEIVGEIRDEYDSDIEESLKIIADTVIVEGKLRIEEFNEQFDQKIPEEKAETIGGFITALIGRIPITGERIKYKGLGFEILEASDRKISKIVIKPLTKNNQDDKKIDT